MNLIFTKSKGIFYTLSVCVLFIFNSCNKTSSTPDDECGPTEDWYSNLNPTDDIVYNEVVNGKRTFYLEDINTPIDICTKDHPVFSFTANTISGKPDSSLTFQGSVYWAGVYKRIEPMGWTVSGAINGYHITYGVGLEQAFPGKPGEAGMQLHVTFPSLGTFQQDKDYMISKLKDAKLEVHYKKHKD